MYSQQIQNLIQIKNRKRKQIYIYDWIYKTHYLEIS